MNGFRQKITGGQLHLHTPLLVNKKHKSFEGDRAKAIANKTPISAYVERGGTIRFNVVDTNENEPDLVCKHVDTDSLLMTGIAFSHFGRMVMVCIATSGRKRMHATLKSALTVTTHVRPHSLQGLKILF